MATSFKTFPITSRIQNLKKMMQTAPRYTSFEQATIITNAYKKYDQLPPILRRAHALKASLEQIDIGFETGELIVGNRTKGVRYGVVFPESGISWIEKELDSLPTRPQDPFLVREGDAQHFKNEILPYWKDKSLEDVLRERYGQEIDDISKVVKINQKDHAQGHICPDCVSWLQQGPAQILKVAQQKQQQADADKADFYQAVCLVMQGAISFMQRYANLLKTASKQSKYNTATQQELEKMAHICQHLSEEPAETFHQAVQSIWFLFVLLQMESNASSFSPGRLDSHLYPYYKKDIENGLLTEPEALEIIECLWIKFNEIVYMRNAHSAKFFAGFPIGFNIVIGGQDRNGNDYVNDLSFLFLKAQEHLCLPQPNLSVRLHENTSDALLHDAVYVVSKGSGMPQFFNDKSLVPALKTLGISSHDALNYAVVGCVEVTTQGNNLGWSDAAMFNLNKVLELTLNNGICLLTGKQMGLALGDITSYQTFEDLEKAFASQIDYFMDKMILACEQVEQAHMDLLPSPFLSSVIKDCMEKGIDITAGGAHYNFSGIQIIQIANLADSLAAIKQLVYDEQRMTKQELLQALQGNFKNHETTQAMLLNRAPKYGNDILWVDELGAKWANYFKEKLSHYKNYRGGLYHTGMYTVSAHVPMGENVGASADGRYAKSPLADGGMSPVYGRDIAGPTAVLKSVARLDNILTSNGGLLNMKFLPQFFDTEESIAKFMEFLRAFVELEIPHIQFNVVRREDLIAAQQNPEAYRSLTVRVAGYTAYFTELAGELQNEIIARTSYGEL